MNQIWLEAIFSQAKSCCSPLSFPKGQRGKAEPHNTVIVITVDTVYWKLKCHVNECIRQTITKSKNLPFIGYSMNVNQWYTS